MRIVYYDEAGDDGTKTGCSPLFVLSAIYLCKDDWKEVYKQIYDFRKQLRNEYGLLLRTEMHTKHFLMNKGCYRDFKINADNRMLIIEEFCKFIAILPLKNINIVINKTGKNKDIDILDKALDYSINRIENDIKYNHHESCKYLLLTDEGRLSKMRKTARRLQAINYIQLCHSHEVQNKKIQRVVEDILPKNSQESHFIQIADLISFIVYAYSIEKQGVGKISKQLPYTLTFEKTIEWLEILNPIFNKKANMYASYKDKYGIVYSPDQKPLKF